MRKVHTSRKVSRKGRVKESKAEPGANFIDFFFFFPILTAKKVKPFADFICQKGVYPFSPDRFHDISAHSEERKYKCMSLSKEKLIPCQKLLRLVTNNTGEK